MSDWNIDQAEELYGVNRWGAGYFSIGENGNIQIRPNHRLPDLAIDMQEVVEEIKAEALSCRRLFVFTTFFARKSKLLTKPLPSKFKTPTITASIAVCSLLKSTKCVKWLKKLWSGEPYNYGLEAGSKPELMAVMAYNENPDALTILNGYKDKDYLTLALLGVSLRKDDHCH